MIPGHPCSLLCLNGTHVDLIHVSPSIEGLISPTAFIAREYERRYRVHVLEVRPAHEAPRAGEMPNAPEMRSIAVTGDGAGATEPYMIRWEEI